MTTQKSTNRKLRSPEGAVLADGFLRVARTGRVKAASAPKQQSQADLINPDTRPQNPAQDLPIQELENSFQTTVPHPGGTGPRPPSNPPRGWPLSPRAPRPPRVPPRVPFSGRPPAEAASRGFSQPHLRPSGWRRSPRAAPFPWWRERKRRKEGSPIAVPPGKRARNPPGGAGWGLLRGLFPDGSPSNRETVPALVPAASEDRTAGFGSHPNAKAMGPAAPASIRLERSFHFVMTPESRRGASTSPGARPPLKTHRSEINHATPPISLCQPEPPARRPSPLENFFLSTPTPYARLRPSSGRHRRKAFQRGGVPRNAGFPHLLIFLWKTSLARALASCE